MDTVRESRWSQALRVTGLFDAPDTPGASALDAPARLAARLLRAPAALVALADGDRLVCLGATGPAGRWTGRDLAPHPPFRWILAADAPLAVTDVRADARLGGMSAVDGLEPRACAAFPLRAPDGEVLGVLCVLDVRPRGWDPRGLHLAGEVARSAEEQLAARLDEGRARLAAARLGTVLERSLDAFVSIDAAGTVTAWNPAAERLFGHSADEAVGRPVDELIVPRRFRPRLRDELDRVRRAGPPYPSGRRIELTAVDRTGRERPVEMALRVRTEQGEPVLHAFVRDIGHRVATRRRLEQERRFLTALMDSLDAGVVACDSDGTVVLVNQTLREIEPASRSGAGSPSPEELRKGDWNALYELYDSDGRTPLRPEEVPLARALRGERVDGCEVTARVTGTGTDLRRYLVNARPIEAADGRCLGAVAAIHDITERHRAELLRTAQEAVARVLAEAASSGQVAAGVTAAVAGTLGWTCGEYWQVDPDETVIRRLGLWVRPGRDLDALVRDEPDVFPRGGGLAGTVWVSARRAWIPDLAADPLDFTRKPAVLRVGLRAAMGLPVSSGRRVLGVLTFFADTVQEADDDLAAMLDGVCAHMGRYLEHRRSHELAVALDAERRHLDRIVAQIDDYVWTVEVTADGTVHPVYLDSDSSVVFGGRLPAGADAGAVMAELVHPDDRESFAAFHAAIADARPARLECRIIGLDGVTRWVWIRARPRREGDRLLVDGITSDVTERRRLAEQRELLLARWQEQVRRLRELDRMKDELVALVSHELRSPIGAIRGYASLLLDDPELSTEQRAFTDVIDRKSAHLQRLVDDLLDLARLDAGRIALEPRPVALDGLVRQAVDDHRPAATAKRLAVRAEAAAGLWVRADPVRLRQVLDNLLSNAVKYTPDGGEVIVIARPGDGIGDGGGGDDDGSENGNGGNSGDGGGNDSGNGSGNDSGNGSGSDSGNGSGSGSEDGRGGTVTVTVADTGIGIPAEQYPRLFGRFFRASTAVESGIKGTGLGLAITRAIVEAHGGTITASPREGGGTVFTLRLPSAGPPRGETP
ncbi:PAS domain-containing sensor histidine kinase [Planomonospora sphaerica]|uniref:PAS domain-containing sensor histidine kinase n=1 Tax=Planomonospora sphaerica TaxID=161355 RepID=UPI00083AE453|nr:PAS domain S-box protein [Planomonospora sphaerica]